MTVERTVAAMDAALHSIAPDKRGRLHLGGALIRFPKFSTAGAPRICAILTDEGVLATGGVHPDGRQFTFDPDEKLKTILREDLELARGKRSFELDERGLPVLG